MNKEETVQCSIQMSRVYFGEFMDVNINYPACHWCLAVLTN